MRAGRAWRPRRLRRGWFLELWLSEEAGNTNLGEARLPDNRTTDFVHAVRLPCRPAIDAAPTAMMTPTKLRSPSAVLSPNAWARKPMIGGPIRKPRRAPVAVAATPVLGADAGRARGRADHDRNRVGGADGDEGEAERADDRPR